MRHFAVLLSVLTIISTVGGASALEVEVGGDPPGAVVWAAPADHPIIYKKGVTPCKISLDSASAPVVVVVRKPGYLDAFRTVDSDTQALSVNLIPRGDAASWSRVPWVAPQGGRYGDTSAEPWDVGAGETELRKISGLPPFVRTMACWAPGATGLLARGGTWGDWAYKCGVTTTNDERSVADLWYVPISGAPVLVWRWIGEPGGMGPYTINPDFSPDGRWIAHSPRAARLPRRRTPPSSIPVSPPADDSLPASDNRPPRPEGEMSRKRTSRCR